MAYNPSWTTTASPSLGVPAIATLEQTLADGTTIVEANTETNRVSQVQGALLKEDFRKWRDGVNPSHDSLDLYTEFKETSQSFDSTNTSASGTALASHETSFTAQLITSGSETKYYKFRSYVQDQDDVRSEWTEYNSGLTAFFEVPEKPTLNRARMQMFQVDGTTELPSGGTLTGDLLRYSIWVDGPDPGNKYTLMLDFKDVTLPLAGNNFAGINNNPSSGTISGAITPFSSGSSYHWQAITWDNSGAASSVTDESDWMPFLATSESSGTGTAAFAVDF